MTRMQTYQTRSVCKPGPPAYIQDPACIQGPASIGTTTLDPRPVFEAWLLFGEIFNLTYYRWRFYMVMGGAMEMFDTF